jgi:hypothetical protein
VRLQGKLAFTGSELPVGGRVYLSLERRTGKRYRRVKQVSVPARAPFAITVKLPGPGRYRALARYKGAAPFRKSQSPYRTFTGR